MEPIFVPDEVKPRGPTTSNQYNNMVNNIFSDLLRLYEDCDSNNEFMSAMSNMVEKDLIFISQKIDGVSEKLKEIETLLKQDARKTRLILPVPPSMMADPYITQGQSLSALDPLSVDSEYRVITLGQATEPISRTHIKDAFTGQVLVPTELTVDFLPAADESTIVDEHVKDAFDPTSPYYWKRTVTRPGSSNIVSEECLMIIDLPDNISNNLNANVISLKPFPENSYDIMAVYYNEEVTPGPVQLWNNEDEHSNFHNIMVGKGWKLIPGYPVDVNEQPVPVNGAKRTKWFFPETPLTKVVFWLKQSNPINSDTEKVFLFGAKEIDVRLETYNSAGGYVYAMFNAPDLPSGLSSYAITRIDPHFSNNDALVAGRYDENATTNLCVTFDLYVLSNGSYVKKALSSEGYTGLLASEGCCIVVTLYPDPVNRCTPALDYIKVTYTAS
jgi:hypothetical protein